jgi:hypothetical protein
MKTQIGSKALEIEPGQEKNKGRPSGAASVSSSNPIREIPLNGYTLVFPNPLHLDFGGWP